MLHLNNEDVAELLTMSAVIDALRIGFRELASGDAALVPRIDLWAPSDREDGYYCLGTMSGVSKAFGIAALRIKSDVIVWPGGRTQEKYAVHPGLYCGFILLFGIGNGEPLALVNDGVIQHMRVGGSAGVAVEMLSAPECSRVGVLGSGGMARSYLEAIALVRKLRRVWVYSPTPSHRELFAREMSELLKVTVEPVDSAEAAVRKAEIVVTATDSMNPTIEPQWITPGSLVLCVTRREISDALVAMADHVYQLGLHSVPAPSNIPGIRWPQSGVAGFVAGSATEQERLPWRHQAEMRHFPTLVDLLTGKHDVEVPTRRDATILFLNTGNQGVQFASVAGRLLQLAKASGVGSVLDQSMLLQNIRD